MTSSAEVGLLTEGQVLGLGPPGSWDSAAVGAPVVRCYIGDNEQRWFLWYSGSAAVGPGLAAAAAAAGSVGVATSADGVAWSRGRAEVVGARGAAAEGDVGVVLAPNSGDWWALDTCHLSVSDVQVLSSSSVSSGVGVYWMFYSGGDYEPLPLPAGLARQLAAGASSSGSSGGGGGGVEPGSPVEGLRMRPGLAMSQDGRNWARIEGDHHSGALFDVGGPGEWDELYVGAPQVLAAGPRDMRMYYHCWCEAKGRYVVGLATSPNGFKWTKRGLVFEGAAAGDEAAHDARGAAACQVVRDPDSRRFLMFYEAVAADGARSIGLATSPDGLSSWQRLPRPLLAASDNPAAWDAGGVGAPCAVPMAAGRWRLYYAGRAAQPGGPGAAPWQGLGLALSGEGQQLGGVSVPGGFRRRTGAQSEAVDSLE